MAEPCYARPGTPWPSGSVSYGHAINFREITRLDPECYSERDADQLRPDWDPKVKGIHTYSHAGRLTVVDARVERLGMGRG